MNDAHQEADNRGFRTNLSVGEILRRTRNYYNLSLERVSGDLRIRTVQLDAIERCAYEELPGRVYALGFIRNYAEYLDLDGEKIIHLFKIQEGGKQSEPELNFPITASESRIPGLRTLGGVVLLFIGLSVSWIWLVQDKDSVAALSIPEVPAQLEKQVNKAKKNGELNVVNTVKGAPSLETNWSLPENRNAIRENKKTKHKVVIKAKAEVWLEIRNTHDEIIISEILKKGERYHVPERRGEEFIMATGNAGGLEITLNGKTLDNLGAPGEVRRGIKLTEDALKAFAKK